MAYSFARFRVYYLTPEATRWEQYACTDTRAQADAWCQELRDSGCDTRITEQRWLGGRWMKTLNPSPFTERTPTMLKFAIASSLVLINAAAFMVASLPGLAF